MKVCSICKHELPDYCFHKKLDKLSARCKSCYAVTYKTRGRTVCPRCNKPHAKRFIDATTGLCNQCMAKIGMDSGQEKKPFNAKYP